MAGGPDDWQARAAQLCGAEFLDGFLISHRPVNLHCNPGNARVKMGSPGRFEAWGIGIQSGVYDEEKRRHFSRGGERFLLPVLRFAFSVGKSLNPGKNYVFRR